MDDVDSPYPPKALEPQPEDDYLQPDSMEDTVVTPWQQPKANDNTGLRRDEVNTELSISA